jgi:hypothetical protein
MTFLFICIISGVLHPLLFLLPSYVISIVLNILYSLFGNIWKYNLPESVEHIKAIQRGKFTSIRAYINKTETTQINNLMIHLNFQKKTRTNQIWN